MVWMAVALGGALGSMARHGVNHFVHRRWPQMEFPLATLAVNLLGCLVIGVLAGLIIADRISLRFYWREFVFVGLLGGFTTFSTFGLDTITLLRTGPSILAIANIVAHVALGLAAVYGGMVLATWK
jgi:CrcB protein